MASPPVRTSHLPAPPRSLVRWALPGSERYDACLSVVREAFMREHCCAPERQAPQYLYLEDGAGAVQASLGVWRAGDGLFSEHYLDAPAEDVLSAAMSTSIAREAIWEVGSLAALEPHAAMGLVRACPVPLWWLGVRWVLVTVTPLAAAVIRRAGIELRPLAPARPSRVPDPGAWGGYYASGPEVMLLDGWQAYVAVSERSRASASPTHLSMAL